VIIEGTKAEENDVKEHLEGDKPLKYAANNMEMGG
jgi:hypothetical protein